MNRRKIRMLYIVKERYPTFRVDIVELFGRNLCARGHEINLVMQASQVEWVRSDAKCGECNVTVGPAALGDGVFQRIRQDWRAFSDELAWVLRADQLGYEAIQVRDKFLIAVLALAIARIRGLRFFFWMSFPAPDAQIARSKSRSSRHPILVGMRGRVSWWLLYKLILRSCDHAFVQSHRMKQDLVRLGIDERRLTPVPMGVADLEIESLSRAPLLYRSIEPMDGPVIGYLGTLDSVRRIEVLVDALVLVKRKFPGARLLLVGDASVSADRRAIIDRAEAFAVADSVEITGFLPRDVAIDRLRHVDLAISPFFPTPILDSTSPTKLIEYMAIGLPVVANSHPEQATILKGSRAGVVVPWGARFFARAICWIGQLDIHRRSQLGARGQDWVRNNRAYSRIATLLESKYLSLLDRCAENGQESQPGGR